MSRILTVHPEQARGVRRFGMWVARRQYGGVVPGILQVLLPDLQLAAAVGWIYNRLHLRTGSPFSRLQREMLAAVVNGRIGGAP
jgi:hypothetical protein